MLIKLISIREQCGGCPTHYTGETVRGEIFDAYLRHGYMSIKIGDCEIVDENVSDKGLDGVCGLDDFKQYAMMAEYIIDDSEAEQSSYYDDIERK